MKLYFPYSGTFPRLLPLGELATTPQPPLSSLTSVEQNTALDVVVSRPMCVSLRCLWGTHRAPRPLKYMVVIVDHVWLEMNYVMSASMKLRELRDVLHGRPRGRDALGGVVAESAAFFSYSDFGGDFEY